MILFVEARETRVIRRMGGNHSRRDQRLWLETAVAATLDATGKLRSRYGHREVGAALRAQ
jgi:hypothetical protein